MLYPKTNSKRVSVSLNGLWKYKFVNDEFVPTSPLTESALIGVPGSFNDLETDAKKRDYVGIVAYEKEFYIPNVSDAEFYIRIGAAGNKVMCYIDGEYVCEHNGGFLPIDFKLNSQPSRKKHRLTVLLNTRLTYDTLPVGEIIMKKEKEKQLIHYDFYNYIGIHRNVYVYSLPTKNRIEDITITTSIHPATVYYDIKTQSKVCNITIISPNGEVVAEVEGKRGTVVVKNALLWDVGVGHLYTLSVDTIDDTYEEKFGIREVRVKDSKFYLNDKEVYFKGFGMHEDHVTIGKGSISALNIRDFKLLEWMKANSFRTSHYPYAEEMYDLADQLGILIINEMPAVGMNFWSSRSVFTEGVLDQKTVDVYIKQFDELIARDKNHPSVVMYSLANEANTHEGGAFDFFNQIFSHARSKTELPLMIVEWVGAEENKVAQLADVIGLNRYVGWYTDFAELDIIEEKLKNIFEEYYNKFKKPIILSEFGTDTIAGLHALPAVSFSEEFQIEFIEQYHNVIRKLPYVIGEHVWNFADFMTKQGLTRINGNKKGVFTRDRQPKMVAHYLRKEWNKK